MESWSIDKANGGSLHLNACSYFCRNFQFFRATSLKWTAKHCRSRVQFLVAVIYEKECQLSRTCIGAKQLFWILNPQTHKQKHKLKTWKRLQVQAFLVNFENKNREARREEKWIKTFFSVTLANPQFENVILLSCCLQLTLREQNSQSLPSFYNFFLGALIKSFAYNIFHETLNEEKIHYGIPAKKERCCISNERYFSLIKKLSLVLKITSD